MNDQEKAQHVRDILRADFDGKTILYTNAAAPARSSGFSGTELQNMKILLKYPERYSIKKESRVIHVNVYEDEDEEEGISAWAFKSKERAEGNAEVNELHVLVTAHPIEIPENEE